jgi:hypothetical protein
MHSPIPPRVSPPHVALGRLFLLLDLLLGEPLFERLVSCRQHVEPERVCDLVPAGDCGGSDKAGRAA